MGYDKNGLERIFTHLCVQRLLWVMSWRRVSQCMPSSPCVSISQRDTGRPSSAERSSIVDWTWDFMMCTCNERQHLRPCGFTLKAIAEIYKTVNTYFVEKYLNVRGREYEETHQSMFTPTQPDMKIPSGETPHHIRKFMMIKTDFVLIFEKHRSWIIFILILYVNIIREQGRFSQVIFHSHSIIAAAPVTDHP